MASQNVTRAFDVEAYSLWLLAGWGSRGDTTLVGFQEKGMWRVAKQFLGDTDSSCKRDRNLGLFVFMSFSYPEFLVPQKMDIP